ncbi:MAG: alpha/beta fold hydrolase [Paracoccaceae bacterium]
MPDLACDDITLHYEISGDGPPLLLLAGMLSDSASWGPLVPLLEPHFTIIRPDNRTTGRTTPWNAPVSIGQMAEDALHLLDHLNIHDLHIAGHSMGGLMAMELAGLVRDRINSLSILCSAPVRVPRTMAMFDTLLDIRAAPEGETLWLKALYPWAFRPAFFENPDNIQIALKAALAYPYAQSRAAMAHQIEALRSFHPRTKPVDLTCPTQVIYAEHDLMITEHEGRAVFARIPGVTQITLPDAGHSIHWDAPKAVAQKLRDFISTHHIGGS